jgi:hypothetical protein
VADRGALLASRADLIETMEDRVVFDRSGSWRRDRTN